MTTPRMTTRKKRKTTKRSPNPFSGGLQVTEAPKLVPWRRRVEPSPGCKIFRHPFLPTGHLTGMRRMISLLALICSLGVVSAPAMPGAAQASSNSKTHAHDFVIFASVFTDHGYALPGARVRVRRTDEKKFRWEAVSDRQGELGIRVKQGAEYELTIEARGFKPQTRKVDARDSNREDMTLQMEQLTGGKS